MKETMKKILTLALAAMMLLTLSAGAFAATATQTGTGVTVIKAADWVMSEYMNMSDIVTDKTKSKVCSRIINAAEKEKRYCGYSWQITGALKNGEKKRG